MTFCKDSVSAEKVSWFWHSAESSHFSNAVLGYFRISTYASGENLTHC